MAGRVVQASFGPPKLHRRCDSSRHDRASRARVNRGGVTRVLDSRIALDPCVASGAELAYLCSGPGLLSLVRLFSRLHGRLGSGLGGPNTAVVELDLQGREERLGQSRSTSRSRCNLLIW